MKKMAILSFSILFMLAACGEEDKSAEEKKIEETNKRLEEKAKKTETEQIKEKKDTSNNNNNENIENKIKEFKQSNGFYDDFEDDSRTGDKYIDKMTFKNVDTKVPTLIIHTNKEFKDNIPYDQKQIAEDIAEQNWSTAKNYLSSDEIKGDININFIYHDGDMFGKAKKYRKNNEVEFDYMESN
ncbi:hypothetical protein [Mammaliicoccus lentus]|uniref:hypothetical protein n=1 Tax=Mammaliicoccus lentus TaxID=42858 RepID=UPI0007D9CBD0|nr:hypothetical protein [Mammaliicoccus lentus]OAO25173.1 hypothetical protein AXY34_01805 [Mammaliicoccus lentus]